MKKVYSIICAAVLAGSVSYGQVEIRAFEGGAAVGNDISGTTVYVNVTEDGMIAKTFSVANVSGSSQDYKLERYRIAAPAAWSDGLCWGPYPDPAFEGQCYGATQMPTNPWSTPTTSELTVSGSGNIVVDIHTEGAGYGLYRYYVVDGGSRIDSIDVALTSTLAVNEVEPAVAISVYPNPTASVLTIAASGLTDGYNVRMTDVLGKVVYDESATAATKKIDVSDFKNGVYLVTVLEKGKALQTKRVVVKH